MAILGFDDKALVKRMLAGREDAFEEFFSNYFPALYRFALTRLNQNEDLAEEVVQATLTKAVRKLSTFRGEAALFTWLCTFCRYEISAHFQKENRGPTRLPLTEDVPEVRAALESLIAAEGSGPEEVVRRGEIKRFVQVTLDSLPPRYGNALEWKYIEGLSVKEIADRLAIGPKAAESILTRARQAFRDGFKTLNCETC